MDSKLDPHSARNRIIECGPIVIYAADLSNPRAFKHRPHPLQRHIEVLTEVRGPIEEEWKLYDAAWHRIVNLELLPWLPVHVQTGSGPHNAACARFVAGLTDNAESVPDTEILVPAEVVADHCLAAAAGTQLPAISQYSRPSTLDVGLQALIGRQVEVVFLAGSPNYLSGRVLACPEGVLVLDGLDDNLVVVPLSAVAYLSTTQRTVDEDCSTN